MFDFLLAGSDPSLPRCVFRNDEVGAWLYHADCIEFMDLLAERHPDGVFDMIFADPPYFLSNGGMTCHLIFAQRETVSIR